jgi:NADPH-dependent 2,4-dienoyl-CoA reductase/sulfur reductase-like enzyme
MAFMRYWLQSYMMDRGFNVHWAEKIKDIFQGDIRLTTVGSITNLDMAEEFISKGICEFVAMCRPLMADPDMPRKYAADRPEDTRPCLRCNACAARLGGPKVINCAVNPMSGMTSVLRDGVTPRAVRSRRVAVVGGGPAGLQAMFTLVERGHDVTLYEKDDRLGGCVNGAAIPPFKVDARDYLKWLLRQARELVREGKARVLLETEATREMLETQGYDAIVIAVGAEPVRPGSIPGIDLPHVMWAPDAELRHRDKVGQKVVVVGAGSVGIEAAVDFADAGRHVSVIEMADENSGMMNLFMSSGGGAGELMEMMRERGVSIRFSTALAEIREGSVLARGPDGASIEIEADTVLLAMGMRPRYELADSLRRAAPETECFIVGDAKRVGNISTAVNPAFQAALHI